MILHGQGGKGAHGRVIKDVCVADALQGGHSKTLPVQDKLCELLRTSVPRDVVRLALPTYVHSSDVCGPPPHSNLS